MFHQNRSAGRRNRLETEGCCRLHATTTGSGGMDTLRCRESLVTDRPAVNEYSVITKSIAHQMKLSGCDGNLITDDGQQEQSGADSSFL